MFKNSIFFDCQKSIRVGGFRRDLNLLKMSFLNVISFQFWVLQIFKKEFHHFETNFSKNTNSALDKSLFYEFTDVKGNTFCHSISAQSNFESRDL